MENIEKIVIALVSFIITSVLAYLFKMRQLYVVIPKLYRHASISEKGVLCELIVFNKGNQVEEDIQVQIDPELKIELLASSSSNVILDKLTIKIDRLHKGSEASVILLVESGTFDHSKITDVNSKTTKGVVFKKAADVLPNHAKSFLIALLVLGIFPGVVYGTKAYDYLNSSYADYKLSYLQEKGWKNLANYYNSELKNSYGNKEFPIEYGGQKLSGGERIVSFEIYNKSASKLSVSAMKIKNDPTATPPYFSTIDVAPLSKGTLAVKIPNVYAGNPISQIEFFIQSADQSITDVSYNLIDARPE